MRIFTLNADDAGQRLDKYIMKITDMPRSLVYKYIRTGHIKVNKKKKDGSFFLSAGDTVALFIGDEFFKSPKSSFPQKKLDIIFETEDLLAVNKPSGMKSQPDGPCDNALSEYIKGYLYDKGEYDPEDGHSFAPAICNRLDVNTSGIVLAAKNAETLRFLNEKVKNKEIEKYYRCIVCGTPPKESDILTGYILKDRKKNRSVIKKEEGPGSKFVKTGYKVLRSHMGRSLLDITLYTGRSHQIRAHMASVGCPIEGDFKYGGGLGTQKLCAYKLVFNFSDEGKLSYLNGKTLEIIPYFDEEVQ